MATNRKCLLREEDQSPKDLLSLPISCSKHDKVCKAGLARLASQLARKGSTVHHNSTSPNVVSMHSMRTKTAEQPAPCPILQLFGLHPATTNQLIADIWVATLRTWRWGGCPRIEALCGTRFKDADGQSAKPCGPLVPAKARLRALPKQDAQAPPPASRCPRAKRKP